MLVNAKQIVVFMLGQTRYALPLPNVERVIRAVEVTPLPGGPAIALGVINLAGQVVPVLDIRSRFGLARRKIVPDDLFLVIRMPGRRGVFVVDSISGVATQDEITPAETILPKIDHLEGVVKLGPDLVLIQDIHGFLSLDEEHALDLAMESEGLLEV